MDRPEIGSRVDYITNNGKGASVVLSGIIIGYGNQSSEDDADLPPAHIAFLSPARIGALGDANWRAAFDRAMDVPHASSSKEDRHIWVTPEDAGAVRNELLTQLKEKDAELDSLKASQSAPTAADLDAVAEEQKAADATAAPATPAGKIRMVKGSKAGA